MSRVRQLAHRVDDLIRPIPSAMRSAWQIAESLALDELLPRRSEQAVLHWLRRALWCGYRRGRDLEAFHFCCTMRHPCFDGTTPVDPAYADLLEQVERRIVHIPSPFE